MASTCLARQIIFFRHRALSTNDPKAHDLLTLSTCPGPGCSPLTNTSFQHDRCRRYRGCFRRLCGYGCGCRKAMKRA
jgi:hypothetical protein